MRNLDRVGFNDRAASIASKPAIGFFAPTPTSKENVVPSAPGDYPRLPWDVDRKISSGRMISSHYPHNAPPVWTPR